MQAWSTTNHPKTLWLTSRGIDFSYLQAYRLAGAPLLQIVGCVALVLGFGSSLGIIHTCHCPTGHKPKKKTECTRKLEGALVFSRAEGIIMSFLTINMQFRITWVSVIYTLPPGFDFKVSGNLNVQIIGRDTADQVERSQLQEKLINGLLTWWHLSAMLFCFLGKHTTARSQ